MSKHDTIKANLKKVTRSRSVRAAFERWTIEKLISPEDSPRELACELCGTRFKRGAVVSHKSPGANLTVGGDCLNTLLLKSFTTPKNLPARKREMQRAIRDRYGALVEHGTWIKWLLNRAPKSLARELAELQQLKVVLSREGLERLFRFHDRTRKYPKAALIEGGDAVAGFDDLPDEITFDQARRFVDRARNRSGSPETIERRAAAALDEFLHDPNIDREDSRDAWKRLDDLGRRSVIALVELDKRSEPCPPELAIEWPLVRPPIMKPSFVWHAERGIGFTEEDDLPGSVLKLWFPASGLWSDGRIDVRTWRAVIGASESAVRDLERLVFGRAPAMGELRNDAD